MVSARSSLTTSLVTSKLPRFTRALSLPEQTLTSRRTSCHPVLTLWVLLIPPSLATDVLVQTVLASRPTVNHVTCLKCAASPQTDTASPTTSDTRARLDIGTCSAALDARNMPDTISTRLPTTASSGSRTSTTISLKTLLLLTLRSASMALVSESDPTRGTQSRTRTLPVNQTSSTAHTMPMFIRTWNSRSTLDR